MIVAENIYKNFDDLAVLKGVSLHVKKAEVISIVGASGAGKTTLLQILGTLDRPSQPKIHKTKIEINGIDVTSLNDKKISKFRNQHIGFIFQFHQLLPEFTAIENIIIPALIKGLSQTDAKKDAKKLLDILGLSERANHKPSEMSGGEQQRIAVARSLINRPKVVFADEPSGNLDSKNSTELHELFFKLRDEFNQTFVIVTHNESLAEMTDRRLVMSDGLII